MNRPHDVYPVRCSVPGYYEPCSERFRVCQLQQSRQLIYLAEVGDGDERGDARGARVCHHRGVVHQRQLHAQLRVRVSGLRFGFRVSGFGFRVSSSGFGVWGLGFRVSATRRTAVRRAGGWARIVTVRGSGFESWISVFGVWVAGDRPPE